MQQDIAPDKMQQNISSQPLSTFVIFSQRYKPCFGGLLKEGLPYLE